MGIIGGLAAIALPLAFGTATQADESARHYMNTQCQAAFRDRPSLRHDRLPSARFQMVEEVGGSEPGADAAPVDLWFKHGEETARLPHGVHLKIELGGCETYSNSYSFSFTSARRALSDRAYWLGRAATLMAVVQSVSDSEPINWTELQHALERASRSRVHVVQKNGGSFYWEREIGGDEGIGVRTYQVEAHDDGKIATLKVICSIRL